MSLVESVELLEQTATVYTLSVADAQAYLVGLDATWVHNCVRYRERFIRNRPDMPKDYQVHHSIPQAYQTLFGNVIDIHDISLLRGVSFDTHADINQEWRTFAKSNPTPTQSQVANFAAMIDIKYKSKMMWPK